MLRDDSIYIISIDVPVTALVDDGWQDNVTWEDDFDDPASFGWSSGGVVTATITKRHWWDRFTSGFGLAMTAVLGLGLILMAWFAIQGPISKSDPVKYSTPSGEDAKTHCRDWDLARTQGARQGYAGCRVNP